MKISQKIKSMLGPVYMILGIVAVMLAIFASVGLFKGVGKKGTAMMGKAGKGTAEEEKAKDEELLEYGRQHEAVKAEIGAENQEDVKLSDIDRLMDSLVNDNLDEE